MTLFCFLFFIPDDGDSCNSQEPVEKQPRLDFKIMNDGTIQVKEHCGAGCSENNEALQAGPQDQCEFLRPVIGHIYNKFISTSHPPNSFSH